MVEEIVLPIDLDQIQRLNMLQKQACGLFPISSLKGQQTVASELCELVSEVNVLVIVDKRSKRLEQVFF